MKKLLSCLSLALCVVLGAVFIAACSSKTKWIRPNFTYEGEGLTIEFVTNTEEDFEFPIEGQKFEHSKFANERTLEFCWVIYNADHELVGWIESDGGYDIDKKGNYKYGFSSSYFNDVYGFYGTNFCVILKTTDLSIFDRLEITSDYGTVEKPTEGAENPYSATIRYIIFDEENNSRPAAGSADFVCCFYSIVLESIDAPGIDTINITLSLKAE